MKKFIISFSWWFFGIIFVVNATLLFLSFLVWDITPIKALYEFNRWLVFLRLTLIISLFSAMIYSLTDDEDDYWW